MARNELRPVIKLRSTAGTGFTYVTRKTAQRPDRMVLRKYDPVAGRHVDFPRSAEHPPYNRKKGLLP